MAQAPVASLADRILANVQDIEQLVASGRKLTACPYYATRRAVPMAELVAMPYNILLLKSAREAVGLKLEGNVVIIDEAHNLLEAIGVIHSHEVSVDMVSQKEKGKCFMGV